MATVSVVPTVAISIALNLVRYIISSILAIAFSPVTLLVNVISQIIASPLKQIIDSVSIDRAGNFFSGMDGTIRTIREYRGHRDLEEIVIKSHDESKKELIVGYPSSERGRSYNDYFTRSNPAGYDAACRLGFFKIPLPEIKTNNDGQVDATIQSEISLVPNNVSEQKMREVRVVLEEKNFCQPSL